MPDAMPISRPRGPAGALTKRDRDHREAFRAYVLQSAEPWHRDHLGRLYALWEEWNDTYFAGAMTCPYILLNEPSEPKRYGSCGAVSGFGGRSEIRLRPSLLTGMHPHMQAGDGLAEGRFRFVADVLLHEMIHQYHQEITGDDEAAYHGHGPHFRDRCNAIGAMRGLAPVRTCKRRGPDAALPSCSQWPHTVRPADFYQGAYLGHERRAQRPPDTETFTVPADAAMLGETLTRLLTAPEAHAVITTLIGVVGCPPEMRGDVPTSGDSEESEAA